MNKNINQIVGKTQVHKEPYEYKGQKFVIRVFEQRYRDGQAKNVCRISLDKTEIQKQKLKEQIGREKLKIEVLKKRLEEL